MAEKLVDGRGEKSDNVRTGFEALELGGLDPVAREMRVVVDGKAIRINDVFETVVLPDAVVLPGISKIRVFSGPIESLSIITEAFGNLVLGITLRIALGL